MSADLFAEFGFSPTSQHPSASQQKPTASQQQQQQPSLIPGSESSEDNLSTGSWDDFGQPQPQAVGQSIQGNTYTTTARTSTTPAKPNAISQSVNDDSVLFDAALEPPQGDGGDDWGEFASAETPAEPAESKPKSKSKSKIADVDSANVRSKRDRSKQRSKGPNGLSGTVDLIDSLSIEDRPPARNAQQTKADATAGSRHSIKGNHVPASTASPSVGSNDEFFDEWGDFVGASPPKASTGVAQSRDPRQQSAERPTQIHKPPAQTEIGSNQPQNNEPESRASSPQVRPTNIPPPSVLLQLFPQLFEQLQQKASKVKATRQKAALDELASEICCTLKVVARVIAGRTLRWKRDSILSQSMRIGPARSGKPGGMKLNTVNKTENIKEKQEAIDVLQTWHDRAGFFNSTMLSSGKRPIQVVGENARVIAVGPEKGALKAPHACALCGLKRDERLLGQIDENVEDSFGEWWTDHWGHTDCKVFWTRNYRLLNQR